MLFLIIQIKNYKAYSIHVTLCTRCVALILSATSLMMLMKLKAFKLIIGQKRYKYMCETRHQY